MAAQGFFLIAVLLALFEFGSCTQCYECITTEHDKTCADPFTKGNDHITKCLLEDSQCGKSIVETAGGDVVARQCFNAFINCDTIIAKTNALTINERVKYCSSCRGNLCNGASMMPLSIPLTIVIPLATFYYYK